MMPRKSVFLLAAIAVATAVSAQAQIGVYGMFTVDRLSRISSSPVPPPPNSSDPAFARSDTVDPIGGTGGVYYDFTKLGPMKLGADLRGSILTTKRGAYINFNGPGARIYSVLGGVRGSFQTPVKSLKPYLQISLGLGRSDYGLYSGRPASSEPLPNAIYNNFQYEGLAGLDIKMLPVLDWRVAEFGYGGLNPFGTYSHNYPIKQVSMGFVFHLP
jgi:hypothetical protein